VVADVNLVNTLVVPEKVDPPPDDVATNNPLVPTVTKQETDDAIDVIMMSLACAVYCLLAVIPDPIITELVIPLILLLKPPSIELFGEFVIILESPPPIVDPTEH
jgi:hypothetical protein